MINERTAIRTCPLCEATCGLEITLVDDHVTRIRGDRDDVFSAGFICPKGTTLGHFHDDPDRLRRPLIRRSGRHEEVSWDEAFDHIAKSADTVLAAGGRENSAVYLGNPVVHSIDSILYSRAVLTGLGTRSVYSASTVDQRPRELASGLIYGSSVTIPVPDIDRTDCLLLLGANPYVSNGSLATAPDWPGRIDALKERGGSLVVVDPSRTRTAEAADLHLAIRPTTDALLLAAIATELVGADRQRPDPLDAAVLRTVTDALESFTAHSVAGRVGISSADITALAMRLADAERPCVYGRIGTTVTPFGTTTSWLVDIVNALLGAIDAPGGAMFPTNAGGSKNTRSSDPHGKEQSLGRRTTAVSGLPIELGEHPVSALAEEIEAGNVQVFVTIAGNPVLSSPDGDRLDAALDRVSFMVSVDCYLNETTRHADVILPPPSHLQKSHFDLAFNGLSVRNVANYSAPVLPLGDGQLAEWEILARLGGVLGGAGTGGGEAAAVDELMVDQVVNGALSSEFRPVEVDSVTIRESVTGRIGPERLLDIMIRSGPYGDWFGHADGTCLADLESKPHGIDFGPLESRFPSVLATPSGRPEYAHPDLMADLDRLADFLAHSPDSGLELINRRTLRSNNSWMHNLEILVKGKPRCTLQMHPDDALRRGLADGQSARITSAIGELVVPVELTDRIRSGVVSMPHGWGHGLPGTRLQVAAENAGANVNRLTPAWSVDPLSGTSQLTGIAVEVSAA